MNFFSRSTRFIKNLRKDGVVWTLARIFLKIFNEPNEIQKSKNKILNHLIQIHGYKVAYGNFKGMKLGENSFWSKNDLITHILGVYEYHILRQLVEFSKQDESVFVDIGAADGYFAVGMAYNNFFKKVYAFEIENIARENLKKNAEINSCSNKIFINKEANFNSLKNIIDTHKKAVILIDIEGGEFELLNREVINLLSKCNLIIELHPTLVSDGIVKQKKLIDSCENFFDISIVKRETYNPNQFNELNQFSDEDRLIALGEGRENNMSWLILKSKN